VRSTFVTVPSADDDIALALALHERRGSRLVPALETLATDWDQTLGLQREAKGLRAGVEASVLILLSSQ